MSWLDELEKKEDAFFAMFGEDKALLAFFGPLMAEVKAAALAVGKQDLAIGLKILEDAAMAAVVAGATAPPGAAVVVAEATFLQTLVSEGITAIHNAEAGMLKAAVSQLKVQKK